MEFNKITRMRVVRSDVVAAVDCCVVGGRCAETSVEKRRFRFFSLFHYFNYRHPLFFTATTL